jgi:uncharacterized protein YkwD
MRARKIAVVAATVIVVVGCGEPSQTVATVTSTLQPTICINDINADRAAATLSPADAEHAVLCLINEQRANHGLNALTANPILRQVAAAQATASVTLKWWPASGGPSVHVNPQTGMDAAARIREAGYCPMNRDNVPRGENVYAGQYWGSPTSDVMAKTTSPEAAVNGWMNSPGHRANILNPAYRESGIAVLRGVPVSGAPADHDGYVFIQCFGGCKQPGGSRHPGE